MGKAFEFAKTAKEIFCLENYLLEKMLRTRLILPNIRLLFRFPPDFWLHTAVFLHIRFSFLLPCVTLTWLLSEMSLESFIEGYISPLFLKCLSQTDCNIVCAVWD